MRPLVLVFLLALLGTGPVAAQELAPGAAGTPIIVPFPLDSYEPDNAPEEAQRLLPGEVQQRTFATPGGDDVDWVGLWVHPGRWRIVAHTTTAGYLPRLLLSLDQQVAEGPTATIEFVALTEGAHLLRIDNQGVDGPGAYSLALQGVSAPPTATAPATATATPPPTHTATVTPSRTPTASPTGTLPPTATPPPTWTPVPPPILPTYTPWPTWTPFPSATATPQATWTPQPTYTPWPSPTRDTLPANPPGPTGTSGGSTGGAGTTDATGSAPAAPLLPTPGPAATLRLHVFLDANRDGLMNFGEETEGVLVYATTRDRQWETEAYSSAGEAILSLAGLPADQEVIVLVPYLHFSATLTPRAGAAQSEIALDLPPYPVYLP